MFLAKYLITETGLIRNVPHSGTSHQVIKCDTVTAERHRGGIKLERESSEMTVRSSGFWIILVTHLLCNLSQVDHVYLSAPCVPTREGRETAQTRVPERSPGRPRIHSAPKQTASSDLYTQRSLKIVVHTQVLC